MLSVLFFEFTPVDGNPLQFPAGACEKIASDLGLGSGFRWLLHFSPLLTNG